MSPQIRPATADDLSLILEFIRDLAVYEKLRHEVEATEERLRATSSAPNPPPSVSSRLRPARPPDSQSISPTIPRSSPSPDSTSKICS